MAFKRHTAEKIAAVLTDLKANGGKDIRGVAKRHGVTTRSIQRWAGKEGTDGPLLPAHVDPDELQQVADAWAKEQAAEYREIARMASDQAKKRIVETNSARDAILVSAISTDKAQLLSGGATSREETRVTYANPGSFREYVQNLTAGALAGAAVAQAISAPKPAQVVDVTNRE